MSNKCICGNCNYYNSEDCPMFKTTGEYEVYDSDINRDCWTDPNDNRLTKEEEDDIIGDREAHRIMVEGREIE